MMANSDDMHMRAWEMRKAIVNGADRAKHGYPTIFAQEGARKMAEELLEVFDFWFPDAKTLKDQCK